MKIQLLGSPAIRLPNHLTPTFKTAKTEALFYYLAVTQKTQAREKLTTLFWGDSDGVKARSSLSKALSELRDQIGEYVTITTQNAAFHSVQPYQLDVEAFLLAAPAQRPGANESLAALQARVDLYQGDFLDGFQVRNAPDFERWQSDVRENLRTTAAQLMSTLATRYQQCSDRVQAIQMLRRLLTLEPWREEAHEQLMRLLLQNGEPHAALHQYELCRLALAHELEVEPGDAITRLYATIRANGNAAGQGENPATPPVPARLTKVDAAPTKLPHNLPQPPTEFVGRETEIKTLSDRLQDPACRLLTLVGPGGIGKTRLALEVARQWVALPSATPASANLFGDGLFFDGLFFVDLMPVDTSAGMVSAIAEATGFTFYSSAPPQQQLFNYLQGRNLLLILDNFEHLGEAAALLVSLLAAAPQVKLLITSRDSLPLQAAYFHAVQGLSFAAEGRADNPAAASTDAVRLFAQRAQRHQPAFALVQNLENVVAICQLVGGLPLALELAAAWLKSLSCAQIAHELEKGVELLHTNLLDIPARHRNMHMVFAQTWQRLTASEAAVMQRLACFRGGFTLAAAEVVAQATIPTLAALAEKALIRLDETGRYQVHELLRQFAQEKLNADAALAHGVAAAHADFFLNLALQQKASLEDKRQQTALAMLQTDIDNLRVAWLWAMQQPELPGVAQALDSLYCFFLFTCRYSEGKELFVTSAAMSQGGMNTRLLTRAAVFAYHLGEYEQPSQHFTALLVADLGDDLQAEVAIAHMIIGQIAGWRSDHATAVVHLEESIARCQGLGDRSSMAAVLHGMAEMYAHAAAFQKAVDCAQACLEIGVQLGRDDLIGSAHYTLGFAHKSLGRRQLALQHYQQGCIYTEKTGDRLGYALSVGGVGIELCQLGPKQWTQGFALIEQSLAICREIGHFLHTLTRLFSLGQACIHGKRYAKAIPYAEECVQLSTAGNFPRSICFGLLVLGESYHEMGDFALSRLHLQNSIRKGLECSYRYLPHNVIAYGLLLEKEATQLAATIAGQNRIDAVALATAALQRPAWRACHQKAEQLLERQKAILTDDQFAAAQALAEQHTLESLAIQILALAGVKG